MIDDILKLDKATKQPFKLVKNIIHVANIYGIAIDIIFPIDTYIILFSKLIYLYKNNKINIITLVEKVISPGANDFCIA